MEGGFHGRTYAALTATAQPKYHAGFEPMVPGFTYVPYDDLDAVAKMLDDQTAAVLVEPIQGEGGINIPSPGLPSRPARALRRARRSADSRRGADRHGPHRRVVRLSALRTSTPDILTCAKALAGGIAAGVMIAKPALAAMLKPGMHASTFGGNPIACRAGLATIETIEAEGLLERGKASASGSVASSRRSASRCPT